MRHGQAWGTRGLAGKGHTGAQRPDPNACQGVATLTRGLGLLQDWTWRTLSGWHAPSRLGEQPTVCPWGTEYMEPYTLPTRQEADNPGAHRAWPQQEGIRDVG